jgi:hypothetical protein
MRSSHFGDQVQRLVDDAERTSTLRCLQVRKRLGGSGRVSGGSTCWVLIGPPSLPVCSCLSRIIALIAFPASVLGPVDRSHGFHWLIRAA